MPHFLTAGVGHFSANHLDSDHSSFCLQTAYFLLSSFSFYLFLPDPAYLFAVSLALSVARVLFLLQQVVLLLAHDRSWNSNTLLK